MITTGDFKSCTLFVGLFESFVERRPLLKHPCAGLFFFYLCSKRNRKFKHLVQTKPMGENTINHIMKVSVAGTSLKESEKKVYESLCKKNNSQESEESKNCKFRSAHIVSVTGHRGINFLNDYDEADEEELR